MNKKNKSIIIGLVVLILLFIGGIIGKRINEENAVIKKAEVAINDGDYDNARVYYILLLMEIIKK